MELGLKAWWLPVGEKSRNLAALAPRFGFVSEGLATVADIAEAGQTSALEGVGREITRCATNRLVVFAR
jgi:hypothetical protein